uniref:Uncharacterized protein n=1 Tax=Marseillevirus LCMAC101 TaxID=2506602 RepID=A0A481YU35_9VIRU|nr:MAG: hypothetical protein LCMAC101_06290 [Marseillevirus LCMAC101]
MDPEKKSQFQARSNISSRSIKLTHSDPIKRLREFCRAGKYYHQIKWDKYANGFMFECEVTYNLGRHNKRRVLVKEVRWVETTDLTEGQRVISAILLDNLGLGVSDDGDEENDEEIPTQEFAKASMKAVTGVLNQVSQQIDNEDGDIKDPLLSMAGGLIKHMTTMMSQETDQETSQKTKSESWADQSIGDGQETKSESGAGRETKPSASWADMMCNDISCLSPPARPPDCCQGNTLDKSWAAITSDPKQ